MGSTAITDPITPQEPGNGQRESWASHFMQLAQSIAKRSTCSRLKVGCVFTRNNRILATGFNGALPGRAHCDDVGCVMHEGHCIAASHAESNAIAQAAQHGVSLENSTLYVTHLCCLYCYKLVLASGCINVQYRDVYGTAPMQLYFGLQGMSRLEKIK